MLLTTPSGSTHTLHGVALGILLISLVSCSSDDNNDAAGTSAPGPGQIPAEAVTIAGLDGTWARDCMAVADSTNYSRTQLVVADNVATETENFYTDNACASEASPAIAVTDASYLFADSTTTTSLGDATPVAITTESRTVDGVAATDGINLISYDIMLITNDTLYFGDTSGGNDGSTEAMRPAVLDEVRIYTK